MDTASSREPALQYPFARGTQQDILPPLLGVSGRSPAELIAAMLEAADLSGQEDGRELPDVLLPYEDPEGRLELAMIFAHRARLRALAGGDTESAIEEALREALLAGERISLREPGYEDDDPQTFYPCLQLLGPTGDDRPMWLLGVMGSGQTLTFSAERPDLAVALALNVYALWRDAESQGRATAPPATLAGASTAAATGGGR